MLPSCRAVDDKSFAFGTSGAFIGTAQAYHTPLCEMSLNQVRMRRAGFDMGEQLHGGVWLGSAHLPTNVSLGIAGKLHIVASR
jgi:hypothetical protein